MDGVGCRCILYFLATLNQMCLEIFGIAAVWGLGSINQTHTGTIFAPTDHHHDLCDTFRPSVVFYLACDSLLNRYFLYYCVFATLPSEHRHMLGSRSPPPVFLCGSLPWYNSFNRHVREL